MSRTIRLAAFDPITTGRSWVIPEGVNEAPSSEVDRVLLLEDLAELWRDDRDGTFWFVPERLVGLGLGPREREPVIGRVADGLGRADEPTARRAGGLIERLDPAG